MIKLFFGNVPSFLSTIMFLVFVVFFIKTMKKPMHEMEHLHMTNNDITVALNRLIKKGYLRMSGKGKKTIYEFIG